MARIFTFREGDMSIFETIAEQRIREAMERGDFDNLSLKGKPIPREDLSHVPEELRMGYKVLSNAGVLPEEMELKKEIVTLERLLEACRDEEERVRVRRRISAKQLRFDMLMERRGRNATFLRYSAVIDRRLGFE